MKVEINEILKNDILNKLPHNYSNLEKALFIYNQLCLRLNYSLEYFLDEEKFTNKFSSLEYIKQVDGKNVCDVVCFTFNAIFVELLIEAKICNETEMYKNRIVDVLNKKIYSVHNGLILNIDNVDYYIDATAGVLDKNDLTLLKYSLNKISGWQLYHSKTYSKDHNIELENAINTVQENIKNLSDLQEKYIQLKVEDETYKKLPIENRIEMFKQNIKNMPDYSILAFNYLIKLKKKLFSKLEVGREEFNKYYVQLIFALDTMDKEYKAVFFSNKNGYTGIKNKENFDSLEINLISVKNKSYTNLTIEELKDLIDKNILTTNKHERISKYDLKMLQTGFEKE